MKLQPYVEKLNASKQFKEFKQKNPDAFLVAGFFVLDFDMNRNIHQIDFFVPKKKKFAAFTLDEGVQVQLLDTMNDKVPEKLDIKSTIDLDALQGIIQDGMHNRNMSEEIRKIIAVLQTVNGKKVWNVNCVLTGMEILKAHVEDSSQSILKMEKTSLMDVMKKVQMPGPMQTDKKGASKVALTTKPSNIDEEIKKLDDLQKEIEKEKAMLRKQQKPKKALKK